MDPCISERIEIDNSGNNFSQICNYNSILLEAIKFPIEHEPINHPDNFSKNHPNSKLTLFIGCQYINDRESTTDYLLEIPFELLLSLSTIKKNDKECFMIIPKDILFKNDDLKGIPIPGSNCQNIWMYIKLHTPHEVNCTFIVTGYKMHVIPQTRLIINEYIPCIFDKTAFSSRLYTGFFINTNKKIESIDMTYRYEDRNYYDPNRRGPLRTKKIRITEIISVKEIRNIDHPEILSGTLLDNIPLDLINIIKQYIIPGTHWVSLAKPNDMVSPYKLLNVFFTFDEQYTGMIYFVSEKKIFLWS
jgi:hypothetical protein